MKRRLLVVTALWAVACASSAVEPQSPDPAPTTPIAPPPPSASVASASTTTATATANGAAPAATGTAPLPLRGGHATPPFPHVADDGGDNAPCTADTLRARLAAIVGKCRPKAKSLCGTVKVRASGDASAVAVAVDLGTTTGASEFVRCVTDQVNAVRWECATPGQDVQVDLGCKL